MGVNFSIQLPGLRKGGGGGGRGGGEEWMQQMLTATLVHEMSCLTGVSIWFRPEISGINMLYANEGTQKTNHS